MKIRRLLVANRSEIAIRFFRAAAELGIVTIAVYAEEDKLSLHRFKADEAYQVGRGTGELKLGPREAYLSIPEIIRVARTAKVDAIHPGYGFLSESPEFADACAAAGLIFIGPTPKILRQLGNKVSARNLATSVGVPVMPATEPLPDDSAAIKLLAAKIGYPVMLKASWGGGGRGMRPIEAETALLHEVTSGKREAKAAFGKDEVYLEKLVVRARHVEVQIIGDSHGTVVHLFERDCSIQRRNQKVIERAPAPFLKPETRQAMCEAALKIAVATAYIGAGTVEFLLDDDTGQFYFIEVNPRIQVEHTVTEQVTGLDIVKAQIKIMEGGRLGQVAETGIPLQQEIRLNGHAMQCRITTEDPENNFIPDFGTIEAYRGAFGFGIRVDGGTAYSGAVVSPHYDSMLEKVTAWAPTASEVVSRMDRALREYRIRGVTTNLTFLEAVLSHSKFRSNAYTTRFIDETPELLYKTKRRDRATKLLTYIAEVTVNGHPETLDRPHAPAMPRLLEPHVETVDSSRPELRKTFLELGPKKFGEWMRDQRRVLLTDTTMRDAHQSLLATRVRTIDLAAAAPLYATGLPELLSLECWGGATFDAAMRFLTEDPWERLAAIRVGAPNTLMQMLLRGANAVGYANYPDNVVRFFVREAARAGMDIFRVFDCFNWIENMRVAIDAVATEGKLVEGAICYTGDILDPSRAKYSINYYSKLAKELEAAGCHVLCIKDMAGLLKPNAASVLVKALREEVALPLHLHTHDTAGIGSATILAAVDAGVDAIDVAMDAMSGTTSQPCLGSITEALRHGERDPGLRADPIRRINSYWEGVRAKYGAFESDLRSGASEVYLHEMPGGQFTNLKQQARNLGLDARWPEVARAYRDINDLFGDIIKVTPSSKVVGDMALMMISQNLSVDDVVDPDSDVAFPDSVIEMMKGELGQPHGGWPEGIQKRVLQGLLPTTARPGSLLTEVDLESSRHEAEQKCGRPIGSRELASWLMYPKVFADFCAAARKYGPLSTLPTEVFYYGMTVGQDVSITLEPGKVLHVRLVTIGDAKEDGFATVFFELNGQPRVVRIADRSAVQQQKGQRKAEEGNPSHVASPMPGTVSVINVEVGTKVSVGDVLLTVEAMKMETAVRASRAGMVRAILVKPGQTVQAKDLLIEIG